MSLELTELQNRINEWKPGAVSIGVCSVESAQYQLSPEEETRAVDWHPHRIKEYSAGRTAAGNAMAQLGVNPIPRLPVEGRLPQWPAGITGSITHSGEYALTAVASLSDYSGVGLDLEKITGFPEKVFRRISLPEEKEWVYGLGSDSIPWASAFLFSAKESFYKAQYPLTHARLGFHDVLITPGAEEGTFLAEYKIEIPAGYPGISSFTGKYLILDDYILTLCLLKAD
jgi:4'-phosphopantetheinyl transferase EntD